MMKLRREQKGGSQKVVCKRERIFHLLSPGNFRLYNFSILWLLKSLTYIYIYIIYVTNIYIYIYNINIYVSDFRGCIYIPSRNYQYVN